VAIGLVVGTATTGDPGWFFTGFWVFALVWNAYWFLWGVGHSIEVAGERVTWKTTLRTREIDLMDLSGNETSWLGADRFNVRFAPSMLVLSSGRGWLQFLDAMNRAHPDHPFVPTRRNQLLGKWPFSGATTGYYERWD
jgi:hypothetical protein